MFNFTLPLKPMAIQLRREVDMKYVATSSSIAVESQSDFAPYTGETLSDRNP